MTEASVDPFKLAEEVNKDKTLAEDLLAAGHSLFGIDSKYQDLLRCRRPDGITMLGTFNDGDFHPLFCLLKND